jgi:trimeric autotransporter adhesin
VKSTVHSFVYRTAALVAVAALGACGGGGDDPVSGQANLAFAAGSTDVVVQAQGKDFGLDRVRLIYHGNGADIRGVQALLAEEVLAKQTAQPGTTYGVIPQRVPSVVYREGRDPDPGYAINDIDPITGAPRLAHLRYNDDRTPYNANPSIRAERPNVIERVYIAALERDAVAPMWEVRTAQRQQTRGDALAGWADVLRAAHANLLAPLVAGSAAEREAGAFMPLALDLNGDGVISTLPDSASLRGFDWDGSGFHKQVGWIGTADGLLVLDRNGDGQPDSGRELFSNSLLINTAKGLPSLAWLDADGDGRLTAADPAFVELRVWRDLNADAKADAGEVTRLADWRISALDLATGRATRDSATVLIGNPVLDASVKGYRIEQVSNGVYVTCSDGTTRHVIGATASIFNLETLCK